jgi:hypothetical protein
MATTSTTGSTLLQPLSNAVQLPIDQVPGRWRPDIVPRPPRRDGRRVGAGPALLCPLPDREGATGWHCPLARLPVSVLTQPPIAPRAGVGAGGGAGDSPRGGLAGQTCACACCPCAATERSDPPGPGAADPGLAARRRSGAKAAGSPRWPQCPGGCGWSACRVHWSRYGWVLSCPALGDSVGEDRL